MAETNHTLGPKTHAIECQGYYKNPETNEVEYAKDHTDVCLVHKQDVHQVTRCEACQKAYRLVYQADLGAQAAELKKKMKEKLTEDQVAELDKVIAAGKAAEAKLPIFIGGK